MRIVSRVVPSADGLNLGEVWANGGVILRIRCGEAAQARQRSEALAQRLRERAAAGLRPQDVSALTRGRQAVVRVGGSTLVTVSREQARMCRSSPLSLAQQWAGNLRRLFAEPYFIIVPQELLVPLGETRTVSVGGTSPGRVSVGAVDERVIAATLGEDERTVVVLGQGLGATELPLAVGDEETIVPVEVRRWAARVVAAPEGIITGGRWSDWVIRRAARNAALNALDPVQEATLRADEVEREPGSDMTFKVAVEASGEALLPVKRQMRVRVIEERAPNRTPIALLISNEPERIAAFGTLLVGTVPGGECVRLLYHHKNIMRRKCRVVIRLHNVSDDRAGVHVMNAPAGPGLDELHVGHRAAKRFLDAVRARRGYVLWMPPGRACEVAAWTVPPDHVVSGIARLTALTDGDVRATVSAEPPETAEGSALPPVPAGLYQVVHQAGTLFHPVKRLTATHTAGQPWEFLYIGKQGVRDSEGNELHGDYGVEYLCDIRLENPRDRHTRFEIALRGGGGAARGLFYIDGRLVETQMLRSGQEEVLATMKLAPRETRTVRLKTMPESASTYPVRLEVRSY
ncbi:MAG: hypothetical protein ACE5O2_01470 [Armatimonadota bacterium]